MVSATGALPHGSDVIHYNQCKAKCHNNSNHYQITQQMYLLRSKGESSCFVISFYLVDDQHNGNIFRNHSPNTSLTFINFTSKNAFSTD